MSPASSVLRYLASCYRENGSRSGITSLESSRVHASLILEGQDEIVSGALFDGQLFIPGKKAASLATKAKLYEKDRELIYGSVFLMGRIEGQDRRQKPAFAPLILYSVSVSQVIEESGAEFLIDTSRSTLNYALLESLGDAEFLTEVEDAVGSGIHNESDVSALQRVLAAHLPDLDAGGCLEYPRLLSRKDLNAGFEQACQANRGLSLVSGAVLFLAAKSTEMRGVLNDLEELAGSPDELSAPVRSLMGLHPESSKRRRGTFHGHLPAILSSAQTEVLDSAKRNPITLAVGPPGTGKSFTIAALAIEAMSRGESVLIASKMDHAVDVVADKIEQSLQLDGVCVRAGRKSYLKQLKGFLENLLSGMFTQSEITSKEVKRRGRELADLTRQISRTERDLERRSRREERWGDVLSDPSPGFFTRWRQERISRQTASDTTVAQFAESISLLLDARMVTTVEYLKDVRTFYLSAALSKHRHTFQSFSKGIRARTSHKKEEYFSGVEWSGLLSALPIWLSKLSDLHRVIPMKGELFDLVIIDEASQCDIASAVPALARAKRAVITGDPKQLRHISFLPIARQKEFAKQFGLGEGDAERFDFRRVSLVDLVSASIEEQDRVIFLNEHFRSRPEIIGFSNREFYSNRLAIMTGHREIDRHGGPALSLHEVGGKREDNGRNECEIDSIFEQVIATARQGKGLSFGILCPFRAQVEAIQKRIEQSDYALTLLEQNQLLVGTSHSFQGEERDIMFLSLALDDNSPAASFRFLEREDVFNVAVTRARLENRIFVSFHLGERGGGLVRRYLEYAKGASIKENNRVESATHSCSLTPKVEAFIDALEQHGLEVRPQFDIGGQRLDLLVSRGESSIGIDLIGFPGSLSEAMSLDRHLVFRRAGIRLFPLSLAEWQSRGEEMLSEIEKWIAKGLS